MRHAKRCKPESEQGYLGVLFTACLK